MASATENLIDFRGSYEKASLPLGYKETSTGLYRSCAALASFLGTFDLILFQALNIEFIVEKVWFGLVSIDGLNKQTKYMVFGLL